MDFFGADPFRGCPFITSAKIVLRKVFDRRKINRAKDGIVVTMIYDPRMILSCIKQERNCGTNMILTRKNVMQPVSLCLAKFWEIA